MDFRPFVRERVPPLLVDREPEILDEIAEHLSDIFEEACREGLTHEAALARAQAAVSRHPDDFARDVRWASRSLPAQVGERWRRALDEPRTTSGPRGHAMLSNDLLSDISYGVRRLVQTPTFTLAVVATMALGIGANTVIFSAIDAVLLRPPLVADPDELVHVYATTADGRVSSSSSYPNYVHLRDEAGLGTVLAHASITLALDRLGTTYSLAGQIVTGNYFDVLGVPLLHGRGFLPHEDRKGTPAHVVVLSYAAWQKYFGGDPSVVGQPVSLNGRSYDVVGITPVRFKGPVLGQAREAWVPMALQPEVRPPTAGVRRSLGAANLLDAPTVGWLNVVARLPRGATREGLRPALDVVAKRLEAAYPENNRGVGFSLVPLGEGIGVRTAARPLLRALGGAVALVLLMACANVAGLLMVRALARQKEMAVRLALGASRLRLVRQWLTESILLALIGAMGAVVIAWWTTPLLYGFGIPESVDLSINGRVLWFTLVAALGSGALFGCLSAVQALGRPSTVALRGQTRGTTSSARAMRLRSSFVVLQTALCLVLLAGAGLFLRTLSNAYAVRLGYEIEHTLLTDVNLDVRGYTPEAGQLTYVRMMEGIRQIPGVAAAGAARVAVLGSGTRTTAVSTDGQPLATDGSNALSVRTNVVSDGYLEAMGIGVVRGRAFTELDNARTPPVAVVSRALAERLWPGVDAIGQRLVSRAAMFDVIGVVPDVVHLTPIETDPPAFFYSALAQGYESAVTLHVRTVGDPLDVFPAIRQVVRAIDPSLVLTPPVRLSDRLIAALGEQRLMAQLVTLFGALALTLAVIGLYGVLAHVVSERRGEIGVRMALGAQPQAIRRLILGQGLRLVLLGSAFGVVAALLAARLVAAQLFGVSPSDPLTLSIVCGFFLLVAVVACLVPAHRATQLDPTVILKEFVGS